MFMGACHCSRKRKSHQQQHYAHWRQVLDFQSSVLSSQFAFLEAFSQSPPPQWVFLAFFGPRGSSAGGGDWHESGKTAKLRTENEMLLLKLAKFYVRTFYIEMRPWLAAEKCSQVVGFAFCLFMRAELGNKAICLTFLRPMYAVFHSVFRIWYSSFLFFPSDIRTFAPMCRHCVGVKWHNTAATTAKAK